MKPENRYNSKKAICLFLTAGAMGVLLFAATPVWANSDIANKTNVRVIGDPKGTFQRSSGITLTHVEVIARNVGTVQADNVQVSLVMPSGARVGLTGPGSLAPNKQGTYVADPNQQIISTQKLKADATCGNCWQK